LHPRELHAGIELVCAIYSLPLSAAVPLLQPRLLQAGTEVEFFWARYASPESSAVPFLHPKELQAGIDLAFF